MYEQIVVVLLCLILLFLILSYRKLAKLVHMKRVIFEWENKDGESYAPRRAETNYLMYEDLEWEDVLKKEGRKSQIKRIVLLD